MTPTISRLTPGSLYIRLNPDSRRKVASTYLVQDWPHIAIDLDSTGRAVGVEIIGLPRAKLGKKPYAVTKSP